MVRRIRFAARGFRMVWAWIVLVALLVADWLIWLMLNTARPGERMIRPTKRVPWPMGMKRELLKRQDYTCAYCGYRLNASKFEIDHMDPVIRGGSNDMDNLQVICRPCNMRKGIQCDVEFRARYARLVPPTRLTPPSQPVHQTKCKAETRRRAPPSDVQQFRKTRFISSREKVVSGSVICGGVTGVIALFGLAQVGAEGYLLLLPTMVLGGAVGFGLWLRAYVTDVMITENEQTVT